MLSLDLGNRSRRFLAKLPPKQAGQIDRKVSALQENPFPQDFKPIKGSTYYRADIGEYRIIYKIIGETLSVPLIGKRNDDDVYKRLKRMR